MTFRLLFRRGNARCDQLISWSVITRGDGGDSWDQTLTSRHVSRKKRVANSTLRSDQVWKMTRSRIQEFPSVENDPESKKFWTVIIPRIIGSGIRIKLGIWRVNPEDRHLASSLVAGDPGELGELTLSATLTQTQAFGEFGLKLYTAH